MQTHEYKVIAAPTKGVKGKGLKSAEDRFSNAIEAKINELAATGWEYLRAEALPSLERSGLTSSRTVWHNMLVFRKSLSAAVISDDTPKTEFASTRATDSDVQEQSQEPSAEPPDTGGPEDTPDQRNLAIQSLRAER